MRCLDVYGRLQMFSIYTQSKSGFAILADLYTDYLTIFFNAKSSVNKTELDFSMNLCNVICEQCNRKCPLIYLFFFHINVAAKMEEKGMIGLKMNS